VAKESGLAQNKPLYGMFTDIPPRYDLINRLITWGMDRGWRRKAARTCLASHPPKVLDLCCGTGDLALTIAALADYPVEIKGLDYSRPMLDIAAAKAAQLKGKRITFTRGDASGLPFEDAYFDVIGISFAFRNLTYRNPLADKHLSEILRVLKPGGACVIAESSQPGNRLIRAMYHFYMRQYVYRIGAWLSGNKGAYRYLAESSSRYFSPAEMSAFLKEHGFRHVSYRPLFFGAAGIYLAGK
jgi:demethylmenaquinone methyltransferase/2-methoxy-6-polyprenyl-1,4-benzoquinol methylase